LLSPSNDEIERAVAFGFKASNNEAEYEALLIGMQMAHLCGARNLEIKCDSQLVVEQVRGEYQLKDDRMSRYCKLALGLAELFESFTIAKIPGEDNSRADVLAKRAASAELGSGTPLKIGIQEKSSLHFGPRVLSSRVEEITGSWLEPIYKYLRDGVVPEDKVRARGIKYRSCRYLIHDGILYRRSYTQPLLRCLTPYESDYVLREIHEGVCGNHLGPRSLAHRALTIGYYWPTMRRDAEDLVKKCDKCQRFAKSSNAPGQPMVPIQSPWPFVQWGIDIIGQLPTAKGGRKYAVVAIDYFTKWAEAEALAGITQEAMKKFVWNNIVCRFGIPQVLISDNGTQFEGRLFSQFCEGLNIAHFFSSPAHPQANGQVEVTNRTIIEAIKKRLEAAKGKWDEELYPVLWAYRTTSRTPTGETPFSLTYGTEAVLPVEIGIPSARVSLHQASENAALLKHNMDLAEELRDQALARMASYKQRMANYFNKGVRARQFQVGDLVLRRMMPNKKDPRDGKFAPNWEGPYRVTRIARSGTYFLEEMNGRAVQRPWNIEHLRKYFQ